MTAPSSEGAKLGLYRFFDLCGFFGTVTTKPYRKNLISCRLAILRPWFRMISLLKPFPPSGREVARAKHVTEGERIFPQNILVLQFVGTALAAVPTVSPPVISLRKCQPPRQGGQNWVCTDFLICVDSSERSRPNRTRRAANCRSHFPKKYPITVNHSRTIKVGKENAPECEQTLYVVSPAFFANRPARN